MIFFKKIIIWFLYKAAKMKKPAASSGELDPSGLNFFRIRGLWPDVKMVYKVIDYKRYALT